VAFIAALEPCGAACQVRLVSSMPAAYKYYGVFAADAWTAIRDCPAPAAASRAIVQSYF